MALKLLLKSLEGLDDAVKALYVEKDGEFHLDVTGLPDTSELDGLKANQKKLLDEAKAAKKALKDLQDQIDGEEGEKAKKNGQFEPLYKKAMKDLEEAQAALADLSKTMQSKDIKLAASGLASQLAKDEGRAGVLLDYITKYAKHDGEKVSFEIDGVASDPDGIKAHITKTLPFLVDGGDASGGGARGDKGAGGATDLSKLPPTQRITAARESQSK